MLPSRRCIPRSAHHGGGRRRLGRSIANSSPLRRRGRPGLGPPPPDIIAQTQTPAAPGARCHRAHERPPRGSSEPARVSSMLDQTDRRRQSAGGHRPRTGPGPAGAALTAPRGVRRALELIGSGRGGAGLGWAGAGTLPRVREGEVCEDLPDDRGIVERGDQAQPAPTMGTVKDINGKHAVHQGSPGPRARGAGGAGAGVELGRGGLRARAAVADNL
jgi:hypothetical protein